VPSSYPVFPKITNKYTLNPKFWNHLENVCRKNVDIPAFFELLKIGMIVAYILTEWPLNNFKE